MWHEVFLLFGDNIGQITQVQLNVELVDLKNYQAEETI